VGKALARIRGMLGRDRADALLRVSGTTDYTGFLTTDLVIEAVFEDLTLKRKVLAEIEEAVAPETVIASNTSAIPIAEIACAAKHPERVVGMHFFSPAERMPLLEVVRPKAANDTAVARAVSVGVKMGKTPIVVSDAPGFYTTRVLGVMLNEAALLLGEGARIEDVDQAMTDFGFPVGPFVLYDEVGLEVAQHAGETVARAFGDRIPAATIVADLVARGDTGRKVGRGFLIWPERTANPFVYGTTPRRTFTSDEVQERLVLLFVNEAMRGLEEGVIQSPTDGDLGAVLGLGFPPFRGGPFHYADRIGSEVLNRKLQQLADRHGERYAPTHTTSAATRFYATHES
jgi:3-hydroxyacyl-CoA dehydrogenase / enoyl-CoA hydratase / 3-hydroxybutyryl-CoA epimerase